MTTDAVGGVWRYSLDLAARAHGRAAFRVDPGRPRPRAERRASAPKRCGRSVRSSRPACRSTGPPRTRRRWQRRRDGLAALGGRGAASVHLHAPALVGPDALAGAGGRGRPFLRRHLVARGARRRRCPTISAGATRRRPQRRARAAADARRSRRPRRSCRAPMPAPSTGPARTIERGATTAPPSPRPAPGQRERERARC